MADFLRDDGKPFVFDTRDRIPVYLVELDEFKRVVVINQFTCVYAVVSETEEHTKEDVRKAFERLRMKEHVMKTIDIELDNE